MRSVTVQKTPGAAEISPALENFPLSQIFTGLVRNMRVRVRKFRPWVAMDVVRVAGKPVHARMNKIQARTGIVRVAMNIGSSGDEHRLSEKEQRKEHEIGDGLVQYWHEARGSKRGCLNMSGSVNSFYQIYWLIVDWWWVPFLALATVFIVVISAKIVGTRRARRRKAGHCLHCGYDVLHVDHSVCPECGRPLE